MQYFLGVDGGGTGCRLRLCDSAGRVLAETAEGPANIATDPQGALRNILAASRAALDEAGLPASALDGVTAGLGLAGVNVSDAETWAQALPYARAKVVTDAWTSTRGALGGQDGLVAAIGTGSVFAAMRGGVYTQIGGWGFHLGDEGSGAVLGRMRLSATLRGVDAIAPLTPLGQATLQALGGAAALPGFAQSAAPADYARLAPALFDQATDPMAAAILSAAAEEVAALIERLQAGAPLPVTWTGGLGPLWAARIGSRWPARAPCGSALDGALALAFSLREA
ncbi:BadF/BadG/BcrA/BcrD ATPase family protein [Falsigemmobacter faecalis]|uniref:ATPase n=1 Tax=Falsigemmobacter faecalis TaxID=2488730 RepID=A0A3P3DLM6_9RHOB|nr:BadF/BadG/BcrA/BcrD ATPase family protein [Falsigemmobacter faecalis]RRH75159.1 ATPase [Falsigemmobacter faecalis]